MEYQNNAAGETMTFQDAVKTCINKYADFTGRASRAEYWWFYLLCFVIGILCYVPYIKYVAGVAYLALFVPTLAVAWRRMHDIGKGGGWFFINLVPLVGNIWFIVLAATKGEPTANRFGDVPLK